MKIKVENEVPQDEEVPLLLPKLVERSMVQKVISQTFQSTTHLANLLPIGSVLAFQLLSPIFTNQGDCDNVDQYMTAGLIAFCGLLCFLLSFTDSFKDHKGNICYGFAMIRGLWVIDGSTTLPPELAAKYSLRFIDFLHAFMSILVFAAVTLFNQEVVNCFYPTPSDEAKELLTTSPAGIGVICSMLFVVFPTKRHGIGFSLATN